MIDFIVSIVLTIALIISFSHIRNFPEEKLHGDGYVPKHRGESSLILPGDGELLANTTLTWDEPESIPDPEEEQAVAYKNATTDSTTADKMESVTTSEEIKEGHKKVNEMIIAFWHGVAAVLIGEASALLVAWAWMKIRGGK